MDVHADKFLPRPTPESAPFWQGCKEHKLLLQHCSGCGTYQFYPRLLCATCMSEDLEWREASGRGKPRRADAARDRVRKGEDSVPGEVSLPEGAT